MRIVMSESCINNSFFALLFSCAMLMSACTEDPEPHSIINIADQYEVKLHQMLSENGGLPALQVNTLDLQECENAFISHIATLSHDKIRIILNDVVVEGNCLPGSQIVSQDILMHTSNRAVPIEINLKNAITNLGILQSNEEDFEIDFTQFNGLKISRTRINKIQPEMLWGSYSFSNPEIAAQFEDYLLSIENKKLKPVGDYGYFYLGHDDVVIVYESEASQGDAFLISTDLDFVSIQQKFEEFKALDEGLVLQATNYDGSTLNIH